MNQIEQECPMRLSKPITFSRKSSFHNRSTTIGRTSTTIRPPPLWISSPDCPLPPFDRCLSGFPLLEIGALLDEARSTLTRTTLRGGESITNKIVIGVSTSPS
ncbi:hypothetical protein QJS04_geneDACA019807 [Acorus gramineus]|uniref:Uncharacterized protein n=1 Tax=Acorus gramineus TaxID=55184 RepID=A0AAV9BTN1_ACOGR|nr:hypothetical protein QJS04_geneDACA019807 [Acorus gramineus]